MNESFNETINQMFQERLTRRQKLKGMEKCVFQK